MLKNINLDMKSPRSPRSSLSPRDQVKNPKRSSCYTYYQNYQQLQNNGGSLAFMARADKWDQITLPDNTLKYVILRKLNKPIIGVGKIGNDQKKDQLIRMAFKKWQSCGLWLKFKQVDDPKQAYLRILYGQGVTDDDSFIGKDNISMSQSLQYTMRLSFNDKNYNQNFATALHEIGHAIGLQHQHQNAFANIEWNKQQVIKMYSHLSEEDRKWNIYNKPFTQSQSHGTTIDPHSIMIYQFTKYCFFSPIELKISGTKSLGTLTDKDISFVKSVYPDDTEQFIVMKDDKVLELKADKAPVSLVVYFENPSTHFFKLSQLVLPKSVEKGVVKEKQPDRFIKWNSTSVYCLTSTQRIAATVQYKCGFCDDVIAIKCNISNSENNTNDNAADLKDYQKGVTAKSLNGDHVLNVTPSKFSTKKNTIVRIQCLCNQKSKYSYYNFQRRI